MSYCTRDDVYSAFGPEHVAELADRGGYADVDQIVDEAIAAAGKIIDGYVGRVTTLPLSAEIIAGSALPGVCVSLAYDWMWQKVGEESDYAENRRKSALKMLSDIAEKRMAIPGLSDAGGIYAAPERPSAFDWSKY